jgi:predicted glycosyltransferase
VPATRVLFYSHDSYGTGHLRRTLRLSRHLRRCRPAVEPVVATGSPIAERFLGPPDAPYVILPAVIKVGDGVYEPRDSTRTLGEVLAERTSGLLQLIEAYPPDIVVVDHAPAGLGGELLLVFDRLVARRPRPRFVLGLRDVASGGSSTRQAWAKHGIRDLLEGLYDAIVVFGWREYFDAVLECGLSPAASAKTRFVGYLGEPADLPGALLVRRRFGSSGRPLVVATVGGGEDGYQVLATLLDAYRLWPESVRFDSVLIGGPLMPGSDRRRLAETSVTVRGVTFLDEVADLPVFLAAADAVIAMAGFNTACEIFAAARPAVVIPRAARGSDQAHRGVLLARHRFALTMPFDELNPGALLAAVNRLLDGTTRLAAPPFLGGEDGFVAVIDSLLAGASPGPNE